MNDEESFEDLKRKWSGGDMLNASNEEKMSLKDKIKNVILNPSVFFERIKYEKGIMEAFKYLAILSLINLFVGIASFTFSIPSIIYYFSGIANIPFLAGVKFLIPFITYIFGIIFSFIWAGIVHIFTRIVRGKGKYADSYKAIVYGATPTLLLGWIPFVGFVANLYSLYLQLKGISKLHQISMLRALVAIVVIPLLIIISILGVIFAAYIYTLTLLLQRLSIS